MQDVTHKTCIYTDYSNHLCVTGLRAARERLKAQKTAIIPSTLRYFNQPSNSSQRIYTFMKHLKMSQLSLSPKVMLSHRFTQKIRTSQNIHPSGEKLPYERSNNKTSKGAYDQFQQFPGGIFRIFYVQYHVICTQ